MSLSFEGTSRILSCLSLTRALASKGASIPPELRRQDRTKKANDLNWQTLMKQRLVSLIV